MALLPSVTPAPALAAPVGRRLRVALVAESFFPRPDDGTRAVRGLLDHLVDSGQQAVVLAPAPGMPSYRGVRVERILTRDRPGRRVRQLLEAHRPDLVHVTSPGVLGRKALKHARVLGIPTVVAQLAPLPAGRPEQPGGRASRTADLFAEKVAPRADVTVTSCDWMAERVRRLGAPDPVVWRPGVDTAAFTPALRDPWLHHRWARDARGPDRVVVGFAGRLDSRRTLRPLVDVARTPGTRLVVVGEGPRRDWLAERAPEARFTGDLRGGDLASAMASLDALVHPAADLTCAHALREAAASGVPVVGVSSGSAREVVRPNETGLLARPGSRAAFGDAVQAVVADRERARMGEAGREAVLGRGWDAAAAELVATAWARVLPEAAAAR